MSFRLVLDPEDARNFPEESISARKIKRELYACSKVYFLTRAYQEVNAQVSSQVLTF